MIAFLKKHLRIVKSILFELFPNVSRNDLKFLILSEVKTLGASPNLALCDKLDFIVLVEATKVISVKHHCLGYGTSFALLIYDWVLDDPLGFGAVILFVRAHP